MNTSIRMAMCIFKMNMALIVSLGPMLIETSFPDKNSNVCTVLGKKLLQKLDGPLFLQHGKVDKQWTRDFTPPEVPYKCSYELLMKHTVYLLLTVSWHTHQTQVTFTTFTTVPSTHLSAIIISSCIIYSVIFIKNGKEKLSWTYG